MRTTPRVILIPKQASSATRRCENLAKNIALTWWQEFRESFCGRDMVTGATKQIGNRCDMVTGVDEEVAYCSPSTSSGKQKKNRSTSQPHFRSKKTPATIEADQNLLAFQQLANNNNSANFHNNMNRISKLPKPLTTTMPTFDRKSEKFELFEDLFQTSLKIHNELTENDRINYFHCVMTGDALQTFKNINGPNRENLGEIPAVFRRKYVTRLQSSKSKVSRLSWWTSETGQRRIRNSCPCHHWPIHICQKCLHTWRNP